MKYVTIWYKINTRFILWKTHSHCISLLSTSFSLQHSSLFLAQKIHTVFHTWSLFQFTLQSFLQSFVSVSGIKDNSSKDLLTLLWTFSSVVLGSYFPFFSSLHSSSCNVLTNVVNTQQSILLRSSHLCNHSRWNIKSSFFRWVHSSNTRKVQHSWIGQIRILITSTKLVEDLTKTHVFVSHSNFLSIWAWIS